jgi:Flp pilus assembly protein TadG
MMMTIAQAAKGFWKDEDGLGTLEMIMIIAVLIAVVLLFKDKIQDVVEALIKTAGEKSQEVFD